MLASNLTRAGGGRRRGSRARTARTGRGRSRRRTCCSRPLRRCRAWPGSCGSGRRRRRCCRRRRWCRCRAASCARSGCCRRRGAVVAGHLVDAGAAGEREVVAVRVLDRQEPQLAVLDQLADLGVVLVGGEPARQTTTHLGGDPLTRVVDGREEHRGPRAVRRRARVLGHLDGEDRLAERRRADLLELHHVGVRLGDRAQLVGDAARFHVGAVDVEVRVRAVARGRGLRLRRVDRQGLGLDAGLLERSDLLRRGDDVDRLRAVGALGSTLGHVEAPLVELHQLGRSRIDRIRRERLGRGGRSRCGCSAQAGQTSQQRHGCA